MTTWAILVGSWLTSNAFGNPADRSPNVIVILADDLGWTDLACYGSDLHRSPHIDRLAADGMRFTASYSACTVCSPTRAALLTGRSPARLRITDWIPGLPPENPKLLVPDFTKHLPHGETTLAERFHDAGYATASIGKWHLGGRDYFPEQHGFDVNVAGTDQPQPRPGYFAPYAIDTLEQGPDGEYITDRLGREAEAFIRANADRPFFLYLAHFAVHTPIQAKRELIRHFRPSEGLRHANARYAAMIESMDQTVGRIRDALEELEIAENTIIIFTSDNGGRIPTTSNAPLRAGKGSCYEGGVRVPLIVVWPGHAARGSNCDAAVVTMDLFPTLLEMAGLPLERGNPLDGVSLVPLLSQTGRIPDRALFWHYPHYQHYQREGTTPYGAVRRGDHKLIEFYGDSRVELYDVRNDPGEQFDLAQQETARAETLRAELHEWLEGVDAQMPAPNPHYDAARPEHAPDVD